MYLVVLPQGVRGHLIDLVRPPCGWSTGFRATPRTWGFKPKLRQKPDFVFANKDLVFNETAPKDANEYKENVLRTPDGSCNSAVCELKSIFIRRAKVPELRAY